MSPDLSPGGLRASALLGRYVRDADGTRLGRIADLITEPDGNGRERIASVIVTPGRWGRLLGYERDEGQGPWLLEWFARRVVRRGMREIPWPDVDLEPVDGTRQVVSGT